MNLIRAVSWDVENKVMVEMDSRTRGRAGSEEYEFGQLLRSFALQMSEK